MRPLWTEALLIELGAIAGYPWLRLAGEGEPEGARRLAEMLQRLIQRGFVRLIVDTREVRFLDPRCCEALEQAVRMLRERGGLMVVVDPSPPVERTLKLLSLERLALVVPSIRQAADFLGRAA